MDVRKLWYQEKQNAHPTVQSFIPDDPPIAFWDKHYYLVILRLVDKDPLGQVTVAPKVPIDHDATLEEVEARKALVAQLTPEKAELLDAMIDKAWDVQKADATARLGITLPCEPKFAGCVWAVLSLVGRLVENTNRNDSEVKMGAVVLHR